MLLRMRPRSLNSETSANNSHSVDRAENSPLDVHIGSRVRRKRTALGVSLEQMSRLLGVAAEQLADYENGKTRIDARDLVEISQILGEKPSCFFADGPFGLASAAAPAPGIRAKGEAASGSAADGLELVRLFARIKDAEARQKILDYAAALAREESVRQ